MPTVFIVTKETENARKIQADLTQAGFTGLTANYKDKVIEKIARESPDVLILEMNGQSGWDVLKEIASGKRIRHKIPTLVLISQEYLNRSDDYLSADDFLISPYNGRELAIRTHRLVQKTTSEDEVIRCGDLVINLANCEVRVAGRIVELTFKEYELLTFLAKDRGRVFTRESLLNKVWGYDYFGGDRTVDVHIRRLRSKIEIADQTYIETVRNIGYRFTTSC